MSLLKDLYSPAFYKRVAGCMEECIPGFTANAFMKRIYSPEFENMELKARMRHTAECLHHFMPGTYREAADLLIKLIESLKEHGFWQERLEMMFLPAYIELYGLDDPDTSIQAMEVVTQYVSCEFAIRPFLINHFQRTIDSIFNWTQHSHARVRRLATEGCRPRLPWGLAVARLKKDPASILPILEALKNDPDEAVRRSVANNLNDISKDHPAIVVEIAKAWRGESKETDAIIKHGCRTLLKHGHDAVLNHYGLTASNVQLEEFEVLTPKVNVGDTLAFKFRISNMDAGPKTIRLEYAIYYRKANGLLSRKVFKISEREYRPGQSETITRNQSFRLITTRKFYEGDHALEVLINGSVFAKGDFIVS
jgi:3-methyladenine DNA glycosylase AlkC